MTSFRRLAAAFALVAPVLVLGACGSGPSEQVVQTDDLDPAAAVAASAEKSLAAGSQYISMTGTLDGETILAFEGATTLDGSKFDGSMTLPGIGDVPYLLVDGSAYFGYPNLPDGVKWARVSPDEMATMGFDVDAASQQQGNQALSMLTNGSADVKVIGEDDLHGTATTHYRAEVDVRASMGEDPVVSPAIIDQMIRILGDTMVVDMWVDGDGYARRLEYGSDLSKLPDPPVGMPADGQLEYVFEMSEFGEPVDVVAPPWTEVMSMSDLFEAAGMGPNGVDMIGDALAGINDPN